MRHGKSRGVFESWNTTATWRTTGKLVLPRGRTFASAHQLPPPSKACRNGNTACNSRNANIATYLTGGDGYIRMTWGFMDLSPPPATNPPFFHGPPHASHGQCGKPLTAGGKVENMGKTGG